MRSNYYYHLVLVLGILLVSCANSPQIAPQTPLGNSADSVPTDEQVGTPTQIISPTRKPNPSPSPSPDASPLVPSPTPQKMPPRFTQYRLDATLNYGEHQLSVEQQIAFTNRYAEPLSDLILIVEPARYPGTFILEEIAWKDGQPVEDFSREIGLIHIPLAPELEPGGTIALLISYTLNLPSPSPSYYGRPIPFGYSNRQTNLVDWYPFIPPYRTGHGWVVNQPGAFGEHLVYEVADFEVNLQIIDDNPSLVIAASAPGILEDGWWQYLLGSARNFSLSVSDQYLLSTTTVDSVLVMSYYFPLDTHAGESVLQTTAEALALYNELFGPYTRQTLTVVEADFMDGMEYEGIYFLSKGFYNLYSGTASDYLTAIAAHETSHQWWYGAVGNDQAIEPWLDEALSTYSEKLYYEYLHPESLDWWWTYRINYYNPQGWVDSTIYNPLGYRAYRDAVYLNGAKFLDELSILIGDRAFLSFLKDYVSQFSLQISTGDDFFDLLQNHTQENIQSLLDRYFENH